MKQAQFIYLMSESLGVEEKTIRTIVRNLREAGLFTTGARGVNAPDITPLDAVRVVIAVVASPSPSRAVRDVRYFGALKPDCRQDFHDQTAIMGLDRDKTLEETLVDCLSNRFPYEAISEGSLYLSERGEAQLSLGGGWQSYYHREQYQAFISEVEKKHQGLPVSEKALDCWERGQRIANARVERSAKVALDYLHQIGFEMIGWDVE